MRLIIRYAFPAALAVLFLSGCATMRYPSVYKVEGREFKEFKELDDDKVVKMIVQIYNIKSDVWEDGIARSISLETYLELAKKRNSPYIRKSGVFALEYDKVKISSWKDEDLEKLYDSLVPKARQFYMDSAPELTEIQNADRITYLTAVNAITNEFHKRKNTRDAISLASQFLAGALSIAMAMI